MAKSKRKDIRKKTKQETLDTVVNGLITQGKRGYSGSCRYRTNSGAKCAAGQLIPDSKYDPGFEGTSVTYGSRVGALLCSLGYDIEFVARLQTCHDYYFTLPDVISALLGMAERLGLDIPKRAQL